MITNVYLNGISRQYKLEKILCLYARDLDAGTICTVHDVGKNNCVFPGTPVSLSTLKKMLDNYTGRDDDKVFPAYIPEYVLCLSPLCVAWYRKSQCRKVSFATSSATIEQNVRIPALVFVARGKELSVFALASDCRPELKTKLYHAPFYNVFDSGRVCQPHEKKGLRKSGFMVIEEAENMFWNSYFTHPNRDHEKMIEFWNQYLETCQKSMPKKFPKNLLTGNNLTLGEVLNEQ